MHKYTILGIKNVEYIFLFIADNTLTISNITLLIVEFIKWNIVFENRIKYIIIIIFTYFFYA